MAAWEAWTLFWLAALQFIVAVWYWQGPYLERTRGWVVWLFGLNGLATLLAAVATLAGTPALLPFADAVDVWTNLPLLGLAVALLPLRLGRAAAAALFLSAAAVLLFSSASLLAAPARALSDPAVSALLRELPLLAAIVATSLALWPAAKGRDWPRLLIAGALAMRFAELATSTFLARLMNDGFTREAPVLIADIARSVAIASLLVAAGVLLHLRLRRPSAAIDLAASLLLAGFLIGFARASITPAATLLYFTIAFVRPLAFVAAMSVASGAGLFGDLRWGRLLPMGTSFVAGLVGLEIARAVWGLDPAAATLVAGAFATVTLVVLRAWTFREGELVEGGRQTSGPARNGMEGERPPQSSVLLHSLNYWERLAVVLYIWKDVPPNAFERTTPALAAMTGVPYTSIGAETGRTNARIAREVGGPSEYAVFRSTWGRAEGLASPRAKVYWLTPAGETLAQGVLTRAGWGPADLAALRTDLAKILAERSGPSKRSESGSTLRDHSGS